MNNPRTADHAFYTPKENRIIDTCTDEPTPRGYYSRQTLEEIRADYPDAVYMLFDEAIKTMYNAHKTNVEEITEEKYFYALEVLPPAGWINGDDCETFKMSEHICGNITDIYARIGQRYFTYCDDIRTPHAEIIKRCENLILLHAHVVNKEGDHFGLFEDCRTCEKLKQENI